MAKEMTAIQLENQLDILKRKISGMTEKTKGYFPLKQKISSVERQLKQRKSFEFLAQ